MKIEELIKKKKDQLDLDTPPIEAWDGIRNQWKTTKKTSHFSWWKVAAIFFIGTSFALLIYTQTLRNQVDELTSLGDISSKYQKIERSYQREIKALEASISFEEVRKDQELSWLLDEMNTLDEVNQLYRRDIKELGDNEQLVNVLIDYYEKKLKLLRKLELEIKRNQKTKENEKVDNNHLIS